jgi:predicted AlkP superfamily pyrophosphatase or phosphodiesterase
MHFFCVFLPLAILGAAAAPTTDNDRKDNDHAEYRYVALFSVDGLHGSDVEKYVALRPKSTIAQLLETGYEYTNAFTSAPSDSFPGSMFQFTGASPKTTGVWYDDAYDRTFYAPFSQSGTHCAGPPGAEGQFGPNISPLHC